MNTEEEGEERNSVLLAHPPLLVHSLAGGQMAEAAPLAVAARGAPIVALRADRLAIQLHLLLVLLLLVVKMLLL